MKKLKFAILLLSILSFYSCNDDEDKSSNLPPDFILGFYPGTTIESIILPDTIFLSNNPSPKLRIAYMRTDGCSPYDKLDTLRSSDYEVEYSFFYHNVLRECTTVITNDTIDIDISAKIGLHTISINEGEIVRETYISE